MMKGLSLEDEEGPDNSLRKLTQNYGVIGYVVLNRSGIPVKSHGMDTAEATQYAGLISELTISTKEFLDKRLFPVQSSSSHSAQSQSHNHYNSNLNGGNDSFSSTNNNNSSDPLSELHSIRLRSKKHEIVITPEDNYTLIVIHNPNYNPQSAVTNGGIINSVNPAKPETVEE